MLICRLFLHSVAVMLCLVAFLELSSPSAVSSEEIPITSYYGSYDVSKKQPGQHSLSLRGPRMEMWSAPAKPEKSYRIGVSFPHLKDSYWLAVNYGILDQAQKMGVSFVLKEAGGYDSLETQQNQIKELVESGIDGLILGSISYTANNDLVTETVARGIPVVEVINDIEAQAISAKALVSFYEMGYFAGEYVAQQAERDGLSKITVVLLPGPKGSGWADESVEGFKAATEFFQGDIEILAMEWGDTGKPAQGALLEKILDAHPNPDYVVGNAVAADIAPDILRQKASKARVVATYITPPVYENIADGKVEAAPADMTVDQARIAVDMLLGILSGQTPGEDFPFRAGPYIPVVTKDNLNDYPYVKLFGPKGFKATMGYEHTLSIDLDTPASSEK